MNVASVFYPSVEVGGDLAQADGGVAPDRTLFISGLQPGEVTHQLLVQVGLVQLGSKQQHRLESEKQRRVDSYSGPTTPCAHVCNTSAGLWLHLNM